ncbi:helix-turn-helix transcriptional regulator [Methylobacterium sp. 37f]|uniref:helix-turn-helix domain-containing protein n=1 Tax=Methylobacterium sp. 37f TaxID=2817058 RepID=UPI001FFCE5D2|nr:helix-turn-helix transcriptional regulator [Methylobacterium sp. 37f]MCK2057163.1 helix-turn-helix domain-containing protein [Methylobacterium sp. 37f]
MDIFTLGGQVAIARKHRRLSQRALAAKADVSVEWVSRFERGDVYEPSLHRVLRVLHVLGLDMRLTVYNRGMPTLNDLMKEKDDAKVDEVFKLI